MGNTAPTRYTGRWTIHQDPPIDLILRHELDTRRCRLYRNSVRVTSFDVPLDGTTVQFDWGTIAIAKSTQWLSVEWSYDVVATPGASGAPGGNFVVTKRQNGIPILLTSVVPPVRDVNFGVHAKYDVRVRRRGEDAAAKALIRTFGDLKQMHECVQWALLWTDRFALIPTFPSEGAVANEMDEYLKKIMKIPFVVDVQDVMAFFEFDKVLDDVHFAFELDRELTLLKATELGVPVEVSVAPQVVAAATTVEAATRSLDADTLKDICMGPSKLAQEYFEKLAQQFGLAPVLTFAFQLQGENQVQPLLASYERFSKPAKVLQSRNAANPSSTDVVSDYMAWLDSQLPTLLVEFRERLAEIIKLTIRKKFSAAPLTETDSVLLDVPSKRFLESAFSECCSPNIGPHWTRLFASFQDGFSCQSLMTAIEGYDGPTLFIIRDAEQGHRFGALVTGKWKEDPAFFSSVGGALFSLSPTFYVYRRKSVTMPTSATAPMGGRKPAKSGNVQYMNSKSRLPNGVGFGGELHNAVATNVQTLSRDAARPRLWIDFEFESCVARVGGDDAVFESGPLLGSSSPSVTNDEDAVVDENREAFKIGEIECWGLGGEEALARRAEWRHQKDKIIQKQRQVDKSQFANNSFDREYLLGQTFTAEKQSEQRGTFS